jgi:hypothetical protein
VSLTGPIDVKRCAKLEAISGLVCSPHNALVDARPFLTLKLT